MCLITGGASRYVIFFRIWTLGSAACGPTQGFQDFWKLMHAVDADDADPADGLDPAAFERVLDLSPGVTGE